MRFVGVGIREGVHRPRIGDELIVQFAVIHRFQEFVDRLLVDKRVQSAVQNEKLRLGLLSCVCGSRKKTAVKGYHPSQRRAGISKRQGS